MSCYQLDTAIPSFVTGNTPNFRIKNEVLLLPKGISWASGFNLGSVTEPQSVDNLKLFTRLGHPATANLLGEGHRF